MMIPNLYIFLSRQLLYLNLAGSISARDLHVNQKEIASKNYERFRGCSRGCKAVMYYPAGMAWVEHSKSIYVRMRNVWNTYNGCTIAGLSFVPSWIIYISHFQKLICKLRSIIHHSLMMRYF